MTKDLPGLDILDFNVNKTSKKVTLSIGYKDPKPQKQLDLTEVLGLDHIEPRHNMATYQDFQPDPQCEVHDKKCPFSKPQDAEYLDTEKPKNRVPLTERPEFREQIISPGLEMMQKEIVKIITDYHQKDSHKTREYEYDEEDKTPTWFDTFVNTDVEQMDTDYFHSLLSQRAADPDNSAIQRRIDNFLSENFRDNTGMDDDDYREFVPGQTWLSREQRRQDLDTTMDGIEVAISRHKTNACLLVSDILQKAKTFENEGRNLAAEIQKALREDEKAETRKNRNRRQQTQDRRNRESLKTQFATNDQVEDDCNNILEEAFTKIDRKVEEKKKTRFETEDKKKEAFKSEGLKIGSFGSSLFIH